jgi:hypothetical protein
MSEKFVGEADDFTIGPPDHGTGITIDLDGDGEDTATVRGGVWTSKNAELAEYLNVRAALVALSNDRALADDAKNLLGID